MAERHVDVLLLGGGVAAVRCARALRRRRFEGSILIVAGEPRLPYNRPPLTKELLRDELPEELVLAEQPSWYERQAVEVWTDATAVSLDPAARRVTLADGRVLRYGRCVLATGAVPRRPPVSGAEHLRLVRTLADATSLRMSGVPGSRVVLIGGGFIGVEVAGALASREASVTLLERTAALWGGALGEELSAWASVRLSEAGVDLRFSTAVSRLDESEVWLGEERLAADVTVAGVGVAPADELARAAGIDVGDGVLVDDRQQTSAESIFAVGDVAAAPLPLAGGERVRVEHWHAARESGERAALAILGEELAPRRAPWVFSEVAGTPIDIVGWAPDWDATRRLGSGDSFTLAYLRGDRVAQLAIVGAAIPTDAARAFVEAGARADGLRELAGTP